MHRPSLLNLSFYKIFKEKLWTNLGLKLIPRRNQFLATLLSNEVKISGAGQSSNYLIDVGCGDGCLTKAIAETNCMKIIGLDIGRAFMDDDNIAFMCASAYLLPFKTKIASLIVSISVIEHLPEARRQDFYTEVSEVLTDDGTLVMQLPNRYFPIEHHSFLPFVGYLPSRFHAAFFHEYVSVPSKGLVVKQLAKAGFKVMKVVGYGVPFSMFFRNRLLRVVPFGYLIIAKKF